MILFLKHVTQMINRSVRNYYKQIVALQIYLWKYVLCINENWLNLLVELLPSCLIFVVDQSNLTIILYKKSTEAHKFEFV